MTTPTITCDHCESEIDIAKDKNCVVCDPSGITAVICEACREIEYQRWKASVMAGDRPEIKRGWRT